MADVRRKGDRYNYKGDLELKEVRKLLGGKSS